jgi:hypothetical protein
MNLTLKERLDLQRTARIITESQYKQRLSEFTQRSGNSYKDYQLTITYKNTKKEVTFDIDSKPTTFTGKWDADDIIEIFQDNYIKPEGNIILTLRDSRGKILKIGNIIGFQDGKDMIINDMPVTQDLKELEKEKSNKLSNKEQDIVDDLLSSLNEGSFDSIIDKIKTYAKRGLLTAGIALAVLGSPSLTAAQRDVLSKEPAIENVIKTNLSAKEELASQYNWWLSYLQSPQYLQRLQKEFPGKDKKWIETERDARLNNLQSVKNKTQFVNAIGEEPGYFSGMYIGKKYEGERWDYGQQKWVKNKYEPSSNKKKYDKQGNIYIEKGFNTPGYETIPAHELGHAVDDGGYRIPASTKEKIYKYTGGSTAGGYSNKEYRSGGKEFDYVTTPTEFINRLQPVRYLLQKSKIYDAKTKDFTEQDYNKMMNNPEIRGNEHFKDVMNSLKGNSQEKKKNFIDLMNTIASNNIKVPTQQDISNIA